MNNPFELIDARLSNIETLLLDIKHKPQHEETIDTNRWFDINELCDYHPDKPTKATIYGWVHESVIPYHKTGKKLRFLKSEIDEWLKQGKRKTRVEIANEATQYLVRPKGLKNEY